MLSLVNILNTIYSSVILKKREFAVLKSVGMSNKQINKMLFLEGIFYGLDALVFGIIISIVFLYVMYLFMIDTKIYRFLIPYGNILISISTMYIVIFYSIISAKRKLNKEEKSIIEEIKNESI